MVDIDRIKREQKIVQARSVDHQIRKTNKKEDNFGNNKLLQDDLVEDSLPLVIGSNSYISEADINKERKQTEEVNQILKLFNEYNPMVGYKNKTQRESVEAMLNEMGIDDSVELVNTAISIQGQEYAPVITTPYELRLKMIKLISYLEKEYDKKHKRQY